MSKTNGSKIVCDNGDINTKHLNELQALGWEKRTITCEPRLSELVKLYRSLDYEILVETMAANIDQLNDTDCQICFTEDPDRYKIIYTRENKANNKQKSKRNNK